MERQPIRHASHQPAPGQQPLVHDQKKTLHSLLIRGLSCCLQDQKEEQRAKRRRLLSAAASARIRRGMIRYLQVSGPLVLGDCRLYTLVPASGAPDRSQCFSLQHDPYLQVGGPGHTRLGTPSAAVQVACPVDVTLFLVTCSPVHITN